ncbi:ACP S-malonyltransferase [Streptomyces sp. NPDC050732]|uniref:ACP S-malonyltransferase n=1 Tax=Streptomyces sp. NPDC050732 TaxID=3154632 RepID=UPI0034254CB1
MATGMVALFPGIGAQRTGMGERLHDNHAVFRDTFTEASDHLGENFSALIFDKANKSRLKRQEEAQLTTFLVSVAMYRTYSAELGHEFDYCVGYSLGEYSALCAAGALRFTDALDLVRRRAEIIRAVADRVDGTMMWALDLDAETVERVCRRAAGAEGGLFVSAVDAPRQVVMSGREELVGRAAEMLEARGGRVYPLRMEGPYHSPLMAGAKSEMAAVLGAVDIVPPRMAVLSTVNGRPHPGGDGSRELLADQLVSPVQWLSVQRRFLAENIGSAIEFGPGNVLSFLLEKVTDRIRPWPVERYGSPAELRAAMTLGPHDHARLVGRCLAVAAGTGCREQPSAAQRDRMDQAYAALLAMADGAAEERPGTPAETRRALDWIGQILECKGWRGADKESRLLRVLDGRLLPAR